MSNTRVDRILALGGGEVLDKLSACLAGQGYAVLQVGDSSQARRMLEAGDVDAVVATATARALPDLLAEDATGRPWIVLGHPESGPVPEGRVTVLGSAVSSTLLCKELARLLAAARSRERHAQV
ncbi:MAG: hypothetical protein OEW11_08040 [Nitrospirota bacterium]|nr:hypothetical protein [Nitrospirota bacterium]